jgi:hypothetical protein
MLNIVSSISKTDKAQKMLEMEELALVGRTNSIITTGYQLVVATSSMTLIKVQEMTMKIMKTCL